MTGPGWVQAPKRTPHPKSALVVLIPKAANLLIAVTAGLLITFGLPSRRILCSVCGQASALFRLSTWYLGRRVQPCAACCSQVGLDPAVEVAVPLVARALQVCTKAGLDLPEMLLTDALDALTDPDVPAEMSLIGKEVPCACAYRAAG